MDMNMDSTTVNNYLDPNLGGDSNINHSNVHNVGLRGGMLDFRHLEFDASLLGESMDIPHLQHDLQAQQHHTGSIYGQSLFRADVSIDWHAQPLQSFDQTHRDSFHPHSHSLPQQQPHHHPLHQQQQQPQAHQQNLFDISHDQVYPYEIDPQLIESHPSLPHSIASTPPQIHSPPTTQTLSGQPLQGPDTKNKTTQRHPKLLAKSVRPATPHTSSPPTTGSIPNGGGSAGSSGGDEDKRQRNSAASARFRAKRKMREETLQIETRRKMDGLGALEERVKELETENRFLRGILTERDQKSEERRIEERKKVVTGEAVEDELGKDQS